MRLEDLSPKETDVAVAYARLLTYHEPRTVAIAHTGEHACMTCDEVWPCDIATVLAGFRDFRVDAQRLKEATTHLMTIAEAAAEVLLGSEMVEISQKRRLEMIDRLLEAIHELERLK